MINLDTLVKYFPVLATLLIEAASLGQIARMFQERSSAGQSFVSYLLLILALVLWERFYAIRTPDEKPAVWTARASILVNILVASCVLYYR